MKTTNINVSIIGIGGLVALGLIIMANRMNNQNVRERDGHSLSHETQALQPRVKSCSRQPVEAGWLHPWDAQLWAYLPGHSRDEMKQDDLFTWLALWHQGCVVIRPVLVIKHHYKVKLDLFTYMPVDDPTDQYATERLWFKLSNENDIKVLNYDGGRASLYESLKTEEIYKAHSWPIE